MIERAELCVHRNSTLKAGVMNVSVGVGGSREAGRRRCRRTGPAGRRSNRGQEVQQAAEAGQVGAIVHRAAALLDRDQAGALQNAEMGRHGVVRHVAQPGDFAGRQAARMLPTAGAGTRPAGSAAPASQVSIASASRKEAVCRERSAKAVGIEFVLSGRSVDI